MDATQNMALMPLISNASLPVQLVMGLLLLASLLSWWFIFLKMFAIREAKNQTDAFEEAFWGHPDLARLYKDFLDDRESSGSLERIFAAGYSEFVKLKKKHDMDNTAVMDGARRAMRATYQREMDALESHLPFLATVGSVSPYVGLLGTVWGIMNAFRGLANVGQATLAHVAPGIAEALVATAMGLFAAIPAVVAYNRFAADTTRLSSRFESFMEEFSNVLQRQP